MKVISLIIDGAFLIAALTLFGSSLGLVSIPGLHLSILIGIVSGFSVAFSISEMIKDVKEKPEKYKGKTNSDSIKSPFKGE